METPWICGVRCRAIGEDGWFESYFSHCSVFSPGQVLQLSIWSVIESAGDRLMRSHYSMRQGTHFPPRFLSGFFVTWRIIKNRHNGHRGKVLKASEAETEGNGKGGEGGGEADGESDGNGEEGEGEEEESS